MIAVSCAGQNTLIYPELKPPTRAEDCKGWVDGPAKPVPVDGQYCYNEEEQQALEVKIGLLLQENQQWRDMAAEYSAQTKKKR